MATKHQVNVISAFGDTKSGYSDSIPLDAFHEFITGPHDDNQETLINIDKAYRCVPWLHRGINLRADAVSRVPWHLETDGGADVTEKTAYQYLVLKMRRLLALTEKSLTKRGKAYWLIETNRAGKMATPRYIPASSVIPQTDLQKGIIGFEIAWSSGVKKYSLEQVVYFVLENDDSEILPDIPPAQVALEAAGLLYASNAVPARFYSGGFVPVSLVTVPITTDQADVEKIERFFKRMATGIKKMFNAIGVREGVDVKTVGHTLKDSITPEITASARDDVAVALGIPPTVLDATSANFATANSEMVGFILNTVFPECDLIQDTANEQFFERIGLKFVFDKNQHEIMQTIQLAQATSAVQLTGNVALLKRSEGRELVGYEADDIPDDDGSNDEQDRQGDQSQDGDQQDATGDGYEPMKIDARLFADAVAELKRANDNLFNASEN